MRWWEEQPKDPGPRCFLMKGWCLEQLHQSWPCSTEGRCWRQPQGAIWQGPTKPARISGVNIRTPARWVHPLRRRHGVFHVKRVSEIRPGHRACCLHTRFFRQGANCSGASSGAPTPKCWFRGTAKNVLLGRRQGLHGRGSRFCEPLGNSWHLSPSSQSFRAVQNDWRA
jgi:hypothetical protein